MPVLRAGSYLLSVEALGYDGELVGSYEPSSAPGAVTAGSHVTVSLADFMFPTTLTIGIDWENPSTGAPASCAVAGVTGMTWTLSREGTPVLASDGTVPCGEVITFNQTDHGIGGGNYSLYFEGYVGAVKSWQAMPCVVSIANNGLVSTQCFGEYSL